MNHAYAHAVGAKVFKKIVKGVAKAAEQHDFVVEQILLVPDDIVKALELRIIGVERSRPLKNRLDSRLN